MVDGTPVDQDDDGVKSRAGYWLGGLLMLFSVIGAVAWLVISLVGVASTVDGWLRVGVPAEATVQLEARKYVVFYESPTAQEQVPPFRVQVFDAQSGAEVPVAPYAGSLTYDFGKQGSAQGTITPPRPGKYRVVTTTEGDTSEANIALGESVGTDLARAAIGSVLIGLTLGFAGLILLIVTGVRRSRARRATQSAGAWPGAGQP